MIDTQNHGLIEGMDPSGVGPTAIHVRVGISGGIFEGWGGITDSDVTVGI